MTINVVRIDDRLIHGQVVEGWLKTIGVNHLLVASDEVAGDRMQKTLFGMAVPKSIKLNCMGLEEAARKINEGFFKDDRLMILLSRPQDALKLLQLGIKFDSVNVGGMHYIIGKKQILRNLSVDQRDIDTLLEISKMGIELEGRVLPGDERIDIVKVLNASEGKKE